MGDMRPETMERITTRALADKFIEEQLAEIITRDCLIGVALPKPGVTTNVITDTRAAVHPVSD